MISELQAQSLVVKFCRDKDIKVCATAQSTYTTSWVAINQNKKAGVVKGLPDLVICLPAKYRKNKQNKVLFIEMKKEKYGVVSKEQKEWCKALDDSEGVGATVCRGHKEAIEYIERFMEIEPPLDTTFINRITHGEFKKI